MGRVAAFEKALDEREETEPHVRCRSERRQEKEEGLHGSVAWSGQLQYQEHALLIWEGSERPLCPANHLLYVAIKQGQWS